MSKQRIQRRACCELREEATPTRELPGTPHNLPATVPTHILDDEQIDTITTWWQQQCDHIIATVTSALTARNTDTSNQPSPCDLNHLITNAVTLAHILRLHPAADVSLKTIAEHLHIPYRRMKATKQAICIALADPTHAPTVSRATTSRQQLAKIYPVLDFARATGKHPVILVPFRRRLTLEAQMTLAFAIGSFRHLTCTLAELPGTGENALRITFPHHNN